MDNQNTLPAINGNRDTKLIYIGGAWPTAKSMQIKVYDQFKELYRNGEQTEQRRVVAAGITLAPGANLVLIKNNQREGQNPNTGKPYRDPAYQVAVEVPAGFNIEQLGTPVNTQA